jgi:hypothetical protein
MITIKYASRCLTIFCILLFYFIVLVDAKAINVFADDFSADLSKWNFIDGNAGTNSWTIYNGRLKGEVSYEKHSIIEMKGILIKNFVMEADVENLSGVDQEFHFRVSPDGNTYYQLGIRYKDPNWSQDYNNVTFWKVENGVYRLLSMRAPFDLTQNRIRKLKITAVEDSFIASLDGIEILNLVDENPLSEGRVRLRNWAGSYWKTNVVNYFDNIVVSSPTVSQNKIIIIPGMGASWNSEAMVLNHQVADNEWKIMPLVNNYKPLIKALESKGLKKDEDFFVWAYDWRRPISEIETRLDSFINQKIGSGEKFDLVGHSLGGIVGRIWFQDHLNDPRKGKIISLGSPHKGAIAAYEAWSGGKIGDGDDIASLALNVLIQLQKQNTKSKTETIKAYVPVFKDILPTFGFLKRGTTILPVPTGSNGNQYLLTKNQNVGEILPYFRAMVGDGFKTKSWLTLGEINSFDKTLGVWLEGRPTGETWGLVGDGTVLGVSAKFDEDSGGYDLVASNHGQIPSKAIGQVLTELGLGSASVSEGSGGLGKPLVFFLGSPARLTVKCDQAAEVEQDDLGFVIIRNPDNFNQCVARVVGTGNGTYHLVAGRVGNDESWSYWEKEIENMAEDRIIFSAKDGKLNEKASLDYIYQLIDRDLGVLKTAYGEDQNLNLAILATKDRDGEKILSYLSSWRRLKKETGLSLRTLDKVEMVLRQKYTGVSANLASSSLTQLQQKKVVVDSYTRLYARQGKTPTEYGAVNYLKLEELLTEMKLEISKGNFALAVAAGKVGEVLVGDIW